MYPNYYIGSDLGVDFSNIPYYFVGKERAWQLNGVMKAKVNFLKSMVIIGTTRITGSILP